MNNKQESELWSLLNNSKRTPLNPELIIKYYSPDLSEELRNELCMKLGILEKEGWKYIQFLIDKYGIKAELIKAAGLTGQREARDLLINLLNKDSEMKLIIIESLYSWGASIPSHLLKEILQDPSQSIRIGGLNLLSFRAHKLTDLELLNVLEDLLIDFREPVVIKAIQVLQRSKGGNVTKRLEKIVIEGSDKSAHAALLALGCIGDKSSQDSLLKLKNLLPKGEKYDFTLNQLKIQYR